MQARELTGRHVALIFVTAFTIIIGVNLKLAFSAVDTFPGLEVKNSYVASQSFDARRTAQQALGWQVSAHTTAETVVLTIQTTDGAPVQVQSLTATLGRATHVQDDLTPSFSFNGTAYVAEAPLGAGNWNIRMTAIAQDGTPFQQRVPLLVKG